MVKRLLIDAAQPEEIRVALLDGQKLEEFDSETSTKEHLRSNIYLAKVIRVEPALQAAFVDYGENRHGFLPFHEIHKDYYRIPVADREEGEGENSSDSEVELKQGNVKAVAAEYEKISIEEKIEGIDVKDGSTLDSITSEDTESFETSKDDSSNTDESSENSSEELKSEDELTDSHDSSSEEKKHKKRPQRRQQHKRYKIQEVIKRQQVLLIQVVKDERGGKGAALTTYLSLAGRYAVLMPNAATRSGGVSKRIADGADRQRLKSIVESLEVPENMSLIVRTASSKRTKAEIRRDYDYLIKLWTDIRAKTLESTAPSLVYEEGNLIKRSIRDYNTGEIEEIIINNQDHYKAARAFMKTLVPSHVKKIKLYKEKQPLFDSFSTEDELERIFHPRVNLPSGGYLIINSTEALVAVDVNSGRAIKERNIEETALKTNIEAAKEVARQLRLRDLAGIVVIDFIDMSEQGNIHKVERHFKESVSGDRARVQVGRIGQFGTLELSRQRLKPSLVENHSSPCPQCHGTGVTRSVSSIALYVLRSLEKELTNNISDAVTLHTISEVDLFILNQKRASLLEIETKFGVTITITRDHNLEDEPYLVEGIKKKQTDKKGKPQRKKQNKKQHEPRESEVTTEITETKNDNSTKGKQVVEGVDSSGETSEEDKPKRRRRRRRPQKSQDGEAINQNGVTKEISAVPKESSSSEQKDHLPANNTEIKDEKIKKEKTSSTDLSANRKDENTDEPKKTRRRRRPRQNVKREDSTNHDQTPQVVKGENVITKSSDSSDVGSEKKKGPKKHWIKRLINAD